MSEKTLRILVAFGILFALFLYGLSTQLAQMLPIKSSEEGLLGGPVPGLTRWQLAKFEEGRELFRKKYAVSEGLGPLYNAASCAECHGGARSTGGAGLDLQSASIVLFAKRKVDARAPGALSIAAKQQNATDSVVSATVLAQKTSGAAGKTKPVANAGIAGSGVAASAGAPLVKASDLDFMLDAGGPLLLRKSITNTSDSKIPAGCKMEPLKSIPSAAEFHSARYAGALYGLGFIDSIPPQILRYNAAQQKSQSKEVHGKVANLKDDATGFDSVGKFGDKAQKATLLEFIASEMASELGISNQLVRHTQTTTKLDSLPDCLKASTPADPNDDGKDLCKINFYLQTLAPPARATITPEARKGEELFRRMDCAVCHLPSLRTPPKIMVMNPDGPFLKMQERPSAKPNRQGALKAIDEPTLFELRALENKLFSPYSDFILHDMGAELSDPIALGGDSSERDWRTPPLWGLRYRSRYLHDGRADNLTKAIKLHGGEASKSAAEFAKLSDADKNELLAFLNSL
jgi:CxxC motif-containing protein (DUF1111 family)